MNFAGIGKLFDTQNDQQYFAEYFIHLFEFVRFIWHSYDCTNVFQPNFFESEYENSLLGFLDVFGCLRCFKMNHIFHRRQHFTRTGQSSKYVLAISLQLQSYSVTNMFIILQSLLRNCIKIDVAEFASWKHVFFLIRIIKICSVE